MNSMILSFAVIVGLTVGWLGCGVWIAGRGRLHPEEERVLDTAVVWGEAKDIKGIHRSSIALEAAVLAYRKWRGIL